MADQEETSEITDHDFLVSILKSADTFNKKLTALALLGKTISKQQHLAAGSLNYDQNFTVFKLIGEEFLRKLLDHFYECLTSSDNHQPQQQLTGNEFCIYITCHFFAYIQERSLREDLVERMLKIVLVLCENIKLSSKHHQEIILSILDCLDYFNCNSDPISSFDADFLIRVYFDYLIKCFKITANDNNSEIQNRITSVMANFVGKVTNNKHEGKVFINKLMEKICHQFIEDKSVHKFNLCDLIGTIIRNYPFETEELVKSKWCRTIRDELFMLYKNRLNDEMRNHVINLTCELTLKFEGLEWIKLMNDWDENSSKFFLLLLKMISIEISMILLDIFPQNLDSRSESYAKCLVIFEKILFTLIRDTEEYGEDGAKNRLRLNAEEILSSIKSINETAHEIIGFLKIISTHKEYFSHSKSLGDMVLASIRFLCFYQIEEPELFRNELLELSSFLLNILDKIQEGDSQSDDISMIRQQLIVALGLR